MSSYQDLDRIFNHGKTLQFLGSRVFSYEYIRALKRCHEIKLDQVSAEINLMTLVAGYANNKELLSRIKEIVQDIDESCVNQPLQEPAKDQPIGILPSPDPHS